MLQRCRHDSFTHLTRRPKWLQYLAVCCRHHSFLRVVRRGGKDAKEHKDTMDKMAGTMLQCLADMTQSYVWQGGKDAKEQEDKMDKMAAKMDKLMEKSAAQKKDSSSDDDADGVLQYVLQGVAGRCRVLQGAPVCFAESSRRTPHPMTKPIVCCSLVCCSLVCCSVLQ